MKRGIHPIALGLAIAMNGAALVAVNASMIGGAEREVASQQQPERIVIVAKRQEPPGQQIVAIQNCPAPRAL
jgi:hypothetical protein